MAGPSWTNQDSEAAPKSGPSWTKEAQAQPPADATKVITDFCDGSFIVEGTNGQPVFVDQISGYATPDIAKISEITKSKGGRQRAGDCYRGEIAQEIAGELPTRAASMAKGIPFVRGYVEPAFAGARSIGQGISPTTAMDTIREAIARREQEAPMTVGASRLGAGIATAAATAPSMTAKNVVGRTLQAAGYGGALGTLEGLVGGFGEGLFARDGGFDEAMQTATRQAGIGGVAGTVFGAAGQPAAEGLGALYGS